MAPSLIISTVQTTTKEFQEFSTVVLPEPVNLPPGHAVIYCSLDCTVILVTGRTNMSFTEHVVSLFSALCSTRRTAGAAATQHSDLSSTFITTTTVHCAITAHT